MSTHKTQLRWREEVAEGTMAFQFAKPPGFNHQPGQSMSLTLLNPPQTDDAGHSRTFTIASSPHEPELMIATRLRDSAFKRVLRDLPIGAELMLDGPDGDMVLDESDERPAVLLAGGIGITPFLAMARHALEIDLERPIHLFYASRRPEEAAYLEELSEMPTVNPYFHLIPTMSEPESSGKSWRGEIGHIDAAMLARYLPNLLIPVYYFAGPPAMTDAMAAMLAEIGVAEADRHHETFYGY